MSDREEDGKFVAGHSSPGPGRPTKYREEYAELAYKFCLLGATTDKLAEMFEVSTSTIELWMSENDAFSGEVTRGRAEADAEIAHALFHRAKGYSHEAIHFATVNNEVTESPYIKHYPPDTGAATLWLKNRQPELWRDKQAIDHTVTQLEVAGDLMYKKPKE